MTAGFLTTSPGGPDAIEVTIAVDAFPSVFAADVDPEVTRVLAAAQRPLAAAAFEEPASAQGRVARGRRVPAGGGRRSDP